MTFLHWKLLETCVPVPYVTHGGTGRKADCNLHFHLPQPSFKVDVEGLLEFVACDCGLMREWLQRGDKTQGWEVLGGIRIIMKKSSVFKNTQWSRAPPVILQSSAHLSLHLFIPPPWHQSASWHSSVMFHSLQWNVTFHIINLCTEPTVWV